MRDVSDRLKEAIFAQECQEIAVMLLTITHPGLAETWRLSSDNAVVFDEEKQLRGTISRGERYNFLPMQITLPEEGDDSGHAIKIKLDNVSRELTPLVQSTLTPARVDLEVVLADAPDLVELSFPDFALISADVDAGSATLTLSVDAMMNEQFPCDTFTPSSFGGLWTLA
ncbi:MAG: DUF1833 family protein [Hyphomicrobiales bacterium]